MNRGSHPFITMLKALYYVLVCFFVETHFLSSKFLLKASFENHKYYALF